MLTQVVWVPPVGISFAEYEMPMFVPNADGVFIEEIEGLGPVEDTISTKAFGSGDGEYFVGRNRGKRNIVLHFGFESQGYDVSEARDKLDRTFYTVGDVRFRLRFEFDDKDPVQIEGFLETTEGNRFASDPEASLSIICPKPNFVSVSPSFATGETDHTPDLVNLTNNGNREVGLAVKIIPEAGLEDHFANTLIYESKIDVGGGVYQAINALQVRGWTQDLPEPMEAGEEFWMDSRLGKKSVYIYNPADGSVRNAMRNMTNDSRWPKLYPGTSKFSIASPYWAQGAHPMTWQAFWYDEFGSI